MAQKNPTIKTSDIIEAAAIAGINAASNTGGSSSVMDKLAELLTNRLTEEAEVKSQALLHQKRMMQANAQAAKQEMAQKHAFQNACNHLKQHGGTRLAGQRMSDGVTTLLCQNCNKIWRNGIDEHGKEMPPHLYVDDARLGGSVD